MKRGSASVLSHVGVFSLLSPREIARVTEHMATVELESGQVLFREGDEGDNLYILVEGTASVTIQLPDGGAHEIARFAPGDFFGEMSVVDNAPRSATCAATARSTLYALSRDAFSDVIGQHPAIALKLMHRMLNVTTQRLRGTSELVSEMVQWGEGARRRAITDELTGVYNRRFLEDSLGTYVAEAAERGKSLCLVMVDLDHFRQINEAYGHAIGDEMIKAAAGVFKSTLREGDVIARYGGDEFVIVLPGTDPQKGCALIESVCAGVRKLDLLRDKKGAITAVTSSMGLAGFPLHATDLSGLRAAADAALYRAKEAGRDRVVCAEAPARAEPEASAPKAVIRSIKQKNLTIERIIAAFTERKRFLILGHQNPDDDCISSMISTALILRMFYKDSCLYLAATLHDRFKYLVDICRYNSIPVIMGNGAPPSDVDTVILCDTPKPSMIDMNPAIREAIANPRVIRIEIDHHIAADSAYFGDEGYRLVTEASSASELIGHILLKLQLHRELLDRYEVTELFPRNLVLAILTGIIGDSNMGQYLKSRRERKYYQIFSGMFNDMLSRRTTKKTNFFTMDEVFTELQKLSSREEDCYRFMMERKRLAGSICVVAISEQDMATLIAAADDDTIISTARVIADQLAEESGKLGLIAYYDNPERSNLVQFRLRRAGAWKKYDLRQILTLFSIANGGGHEGAIGFRIPRTEIADFPSYVNELIEGIEKAISS